MNYLTYTSTPCCANCDEPITFAADVRRCFGDEAPDGAECRIWRGAIYCATCYDRHHLEHEQSDAGEQRRAEIAYDRMLSEDDHDARLDSVRDRRTA